MGFLLGNTIKAIHIITELNMTFAHTHQPITSSGENFYFYKIEDFNHGSWLPDTPENRFGCGNSPGWTICEASDYQSMKWKNPRSQRK